MRRLRHWWKHITFDKKMQWFLFLSIMIIAVIVLTVSTFSALSSITTKSRMLMETQISSTAESVDGRLAQFKNTAVSIMLDNSVKEYLHTSTDRRLAQLILANTQVRNSLNAYLLLWEDINFLTVIRNWPGDYVLRGTQSAQFDRMYEADKVNAIPAGYGGMALSRGTGYSDNTTLTLYMPIYSGLHLNRKTGDLCINIDQGLLPAALANQNASLAFDSYLVGDGGLVFEGSEGEQAEQAFPYVEQLSGINGAFEADGRLFLYQRIGAWQFYLVGALPLRTLYGESIQTVLVLGAVILLLVVLAMVLGSYIIKRMYASLGKVTQGMEAVSGGDLNIRLPEAELSEDFQKIYDGFNHMAEQITLLMDRVKAEEREVERLHFNTLQAQIHPHFLYNTLDCIRWMAVAQGNTDIASMVKALAQYYRISLSRGKDVITIAEEIEFTKNYLVIQNIRYGNRVQCTFDVPQDLLGEHIPKITLQPLVENYFNHGFSQEAEQGLLRVTGEMQENRLVLVVEDNGIGLSQEAVDELNASLSLPAERAGYGVKNVNRRIQLLFGASYGLRYFQSSMGGVSVYIFLPREEKHVQLIDS